MPTQINTNQIKDGAITIDKCNIQLSAFPVLQSLDMSSGGDGSYPIVNLADPTNAQDATTKIYVDDSIAEALTSVLIFRGVIDCAANPNYPAAIVGDVYVISVAGKLGGASGVVVEAGDTVYCITDNGGGTQGSVGADFKIVQANVTGVVIGPASATDGGFALYDGASGKLIKSTGITFSTDGTFAANSDSLIPSQKAIKTYVDGVAAVPTFATGEVPTGAIDGENAAFTLAHTPASASAAVYANGVRQALTTDYTIATNTITFGGGSIPQTGDTLLVDYRY